VVVLHCITLLLRVPFDNRGGLHWGVFQLRYHRQYSSPRASNVPEVPRKARAMQCSQ
jgi:hypothetical protein